jgi:hypothetical protein
MNEKHNEIHGNNQKYNKNRTRFDNRWKGICSSSYLYEYIVSYLDKFKNVISKEIKLRTVASN